MDNRAARRRGVGRVGRNFDRRRLRLCEPVRSDTISRLSTSAPAPTRRPPRPARCGFPRQASNLMIRLTNARKCYGRQTLYDGIEASIVRGDRIGLLGKNGSGKSTLFKVLMGEEHLDAGTVLRDRKCSIG